jgi:hypothetical protein
MGSSPVQGVLWTVCRIIKLDKLSGPNKGLWAIDERMDDVMAVLWTMPHQERRSGSTQYNVYSKMKIVHLLYSRSWLPFIHSKDPITCIHQRVISFPVRSSTDHDPYSNWSGPLNVASTHWNSSGFSHIKAQFIYFLKLIFLWIMFHI